MTSKQKVGFIKNELIKLIGPIGKFIVEKQIKNMGYTDENIPDEKINELIDTVVEMGIYDANVSKTIKTKLHNLVDKVE